MQLTWQMTNKTNRPANAIFDAIFNFLIVWKSFCCRMQYCCFQNDNFEKIPSKQILINICFDKLNTICTNRNRIRHLISKWMHDLWPSSCAQLSLFSLCNAIFQAIVYQFLIIAIHSQVKREQILIDVFFIFLSHACMWELRSYSSQTKLYAWCVPEKKIAVVSWAITVHG